MRSPSTQVVTEAVEIENFENHLGWVIGLDQRTSAEVYAPHDPPRLVIDIQHP